VSQILSLPSAIYQPFAVISNMVGQLLTAKVVTTGGSVSALAKPRGDPDCL